MHLGSDFNSYGNRVWFDAQEKGSTVLEMTIHEGKNRQVRKMIGAVGHQVRELKRIAIGNVKLGRLKEGSVRKLRQEEVKGLIGN